MKIAVMGAGASGMAAAITAARTDPQAEVFLLERQTRAGKKLLATGNGRCNLTNSVMDTRFFHSEYPALAHSVLSRFGYAETLAFFHSLGLVETQEESGRVYPFSNRANSVLDVLRLGLEAHGVTLLCGCEVLSARKKGKTFQIDYRAEEKEDVLQADRLIVCAGGMAAKKLGATSDGYRILQQFGHERTRLFPSLVKLTTDPTYPRALKGIRTDARISILLGEKTLAQSAGEIQFTENGVSGPAAFEVSRAASSQKADTVALDVCRVLSHEALLECLSQRAAQSPTLLCEEIFTGILHSRLSKMLVRYAGLSGQTPCGTLSRVQLELLCRAAHDFRLPLRGTADFIDAQVTAGGVRCDGFSQDMESLLCGGLFAAGEVLDVDGDCGGYNLQWAWATGCIAGRAAAKERPKR